MHFRFTLLILGGFTAVCLSAVSFADDRAGLWESSPQLLNILQGDFGPGEGFGSGNGKTAPFKTISISTTFQYSLLISGSAANHKNLGGDVDYSDGWQNGLGFRVFGAFHISSALDVHIMAGYDSFSSAGWSLYKPPDDKERYEWDGMGIVPILVGGTLRLPVFSPSKDWFSSKTWVPDGLIVRFRLGFGVAMMPSIDLTVREVKDNKLKGVYSYWDGSTQLAFQTCIGVEYRVMQNFGVFTEFGYQIYGTPEVEQGFNAATDDKQASDSLGVFPLLVGVVLSF
ncbi:MAG: hypothetical protein ACYS47_16825 [Planctomycetota bacterium]|jgi:hypothetical protein